MYTSFNYKTKKAIKDDIARRQELTQPILPGQEVDIIARQSEFNKLTNRLTVYQPNSDLTGTVPPTNGTVTLEGPHYPEPHRWYAQGTLENGVLVKVK